jgi:hypothetical protein
MRSSEPRFARRNLFRMVTLGVAAVVSGRAFAQSNAYPFGPYGPYGPNGPCDSCAGSPVEYERFENAAVPLDQRQAFDASFPDPVGPPGYVDNDGPPPSGGSCFVKGTMVRTPFGERPVEDFRISDLVLTLDGKMQPILEVYRAHFSDPWPRYAWPIRIARSAIAPDVPNADLYISGGHALWIDGALVAASDLINGRTIVEVDGSGDDDIEYFHFKLPRHEVIYAAGAPCESMLDVRTGEFSVAQLRLGIRRLARRSVCADRHEAKRIHDRLA